jgi:hypothetical protein
LYGLPISRILGVMRFRVRNNITAGINRKCDVGFPRFAIKKNPLPRF